MATITFRVDDDLKAQLQELLDYAGIDMTTYFNMITRKAVQEQVIDCYIKRTPGAATKFIKCAQSDMSKQPATEKHAEKEDYQRPNFSDMLKSAHESKGEKHE